MDSNEVLKLVWEAYEAEIASRNSEDYEINQEQMDKFTIAYSTLYRIAHDCHGKIEPIRFSPSEENGGITIYAHLVYLRDMDLVDFCKVLLDASAVSLDATTNGEVCVSLVIPKIFKPKSDS